MGNLFLPIILVRLLNPADVGIYKIFFLHLLTIPFLVMAGGPLHSIFYWIGQSDSAERTKFLNATWILTLLTSSLVLVIGLPLQAFLSEMLGLSTEYVQLLLLTGFLVCPSGHFSETTIASGRPAFGAVFSAGFEITKTIGFIAIAWQYRSLYGIFLFYALLLSLKLIISFALNHRHYSISFRTDGLYLKKVLRYCMPIALTGCLGFFIDKLDLLILSSHLNADDFAFYSMGCLVIPPLYILEMSVQKVLIPGLSRTYVQQDWRGAAGHFRKGISDIAYLIVPALFGLVTFAAPIVSVLYTDQYRESVTYLQIFAFSYLLLMIPHDSAARASGKTDWILKTYVVLTPLSLLILYFAAGAANPAQLLLLSLVLKALPKIIGLVYSRQIMHWQWSEMFPGKELICYFGLSAALAVASYLVKPFFANAVNWFLVCAPVFALIYLGTLMLLTGNKAVAETGAMTNS